MYGKVPFQNLFTMKLMREQDCLRKEKIQLIKLYKTQSNNFWNDMDLRCDNVISTSVSIVKCMGEYISKNVLP